LLQDSTNVDRPATLPANAPSVRASTRSSRRPRRSSSSAASLPRSIASASPWSWPTHGRKVAIIGRSLDNSTEIAQDLGYLELPQGLIINPGQIRDLPANKVCVMITGTQGEPMSALRAAVNNHKFAKIDAGDTVLLSSRVIPGNEKSIYRMIDHLERRDAKSSTTTAPPDSSTSADTAARKSSG
jgi:ribonuclease J